MPSTPGLDATPIGHHDPALDDSLLAVLDRQRPEGAVAATGHVTVAASLGFDGQPFDRLERVIGRWIAERGLGRSAVLHGIDRAASSLALPVLNPRAVCSVVGDAQVAVITAEPVLVAACHERGRTPIVMPRRPEIAECDDDREVRYARNLADSGLADLAMSSSDLIALLDERLGEPERRAVSPTRRSDDVADIVGYWARVTVAERRRDRRSL